MSRLLKDGPIRRLLKGQDVSSEPTPPDSVLTWYLEELQGALQDEKSAIKMYQSISSKASEIGYQEHATEIRNIMFDEERHQRKLSELIRGVEDELRKRGWKL
ncbi:MAG: ferritin family protein [Chloroflexota bacterium]|nr:ferritin family protein [Chloroflexota bacterium]